MYNYVGLNSPTATRVLKAALNDQHVRIQVCLRCLTLLFYGTEEATKERKSYCLKTLLNFPVNS
ncbi:unnamed protein product [Brassica rapa]|nr:unnamed protein product [Brassica napus]CAG7887438.1 unnamed protein product [Brassica rapa]VDC74940.1 unnamed protein product [Brassica rapa]